MLPGFGGARGIATCDAAIPDADIKRMMWAMAWPHPMVKSNLPDEMNLLNTLRWWMPAEAAWRCVLLS